mmetsp:Transcript_120775/g.352768  ORF Transcript_120775/g.352768 Transcript_120775/m.352768 type:complete len:222 (+) Transcript_120775:705-1370(+)
MEEIALELVMAVTAGHGLSSLRRRRLLPRSLGSQLPLGICWRWQTWTPICVTSAAVGLKLALPKVVMGIPFRMLSDWRWHIHKCLLHLDAIRRMRGSMMMPSRHACSIRFPPVGQRPLHGASSAWITHCLIGAGSLTTVSSSRTFSRGSWILPSLEACPSCSTSGALQRVSPAMWKRTLCGSCDGGSRGIGRRTCTAIIFQAWSRRSSLNGPTSSSVSQAR